MNHVDIGDRVITPDKGAGLIVSLESFRSDGKPFYITDPRGPDRDAPAGSNRWGVKLDEFAPYLTDNIGYFVNDDLRREQ